MSTVRQDNEFAYDMKEYVDVSPKLLERAIEWIAKEIEPEDVYDEKKLAAWAEANGYTKE